MTYANVVIDESAPCPFSFNGFHAPGDFNAHLLAGELAIVPLMAEHLRLCRESEETGRLFRAQLERVHAIFIPRADGEWSHCNLSIRLNGVPSDYDSLREDYRRQIDCCLELQWSSFHFQERAFFQDREPVAKSYSLRLRATELIEMSKALYADNRVECLNGNASCIGWTHYLAERLGVEFPANYKSLSQQFNERESASIFLDSLSRTLQEQQAARRSVLPCPPPRPRR